MNWIDRITLPFAPRWTLDRMRARAAADIVRSYDAASGGRRTDSWRRNRGDANAAQRVARISLREHARDLVRNAGYVKHAQSVIANNMIGWGVVPKSSSGIEQVDAKAMEKWKLWANDTGCDADGRLDFAGLQHSAAQAIFTDGEVLFRRRWRRPEDGAPLNLQVQLLEADYLDNAKNLLVGSQGGPVVDGVEYDAIGRRTGYWLFESHPGAAFGAAMPVSKFVPESEILHVFLPERPGAARGISWLGASIVTMKDLDEYEDAELMKQKIAACFAAFVTDIDGASAPLGSLSTPTDSGLGVEAFEPGMVHQLPPGKQVTIANPPGVTADTFAIRNLRKIAVGLGITYEDLTDDYSQVNFSSARMGRIAHQGMLRQWQSKMIIPVLCAGVWRWVMQAASIKIAPDNLAPPAQWTVPPLAMIEPDKEGLAYSRLVRNGVMTPSEVVREQGGDPDQHFEEYAKDMARLDALKITLDSDVRAVSQAGLTQLRVGATPKPDQNA